MLAAALALLLPRLLTHSPTHVLAHQPMNRPTERKGMGPNFRGFRNFMLQTQLKGQVQPIEPCRPGGKAQILFAMRDSQWGEFKDTKVTKKLTDAWKSVGACASASASATASYVTGRLICVHVLILVTAYSLRCSQGGGESARGALTRRDHLTA